MEIKSTRNPPTIRLEWPGLIGREPFIIYNEEEARLIATQFIDALQVFRKVKDVKINSTTG